MIFYIRIYKNIQKNKIDIDKIIEFYNLYNTGKINLNTFVKKDDDFFIHETKIKIPNSKKIDKDGKTRFYSIIIKTDINNVNINISVGYARLM